MSLFWIFATALLLAVFVLAFVPLRRVQEKGANWTMLVIVLVVPLAAILLYQAFSNYVPQAAHASVDPVEDMVARLESRLAREGGDANEYAIPLEESFVLFIPEGGGSTNITVREWFAEDVIARQQRVHKLAPSGTWTMVRFALAEPLVLTNAGLREAGFTGAPQGEKLNPNNSDELRVLAGGGSSLEAPRARILMDGNGGFVFWTGGDFLGSAESFEINNGDTVGIETRRSTQPIVWTVPFVP